VVGCVLSLCGRIGDGLGHSVRLPRLLSLYGENNKVKFHGRRKSDNGSNGASAFDTASGGRSGHAAHSSLAGGTAG